IPRPLRRVACERPSPARTRGRMSMAPTVTKIGLWVSNAYLVRGSRPILVDTGSPREEAKILRALEPEGVRAADLSLLLHTPVHSDHVGSTAALRGSTKAPTAYHGADDAIMRRGNNGKLKPTRPGGWIPAKVFSGVAFPTFSPDLRMAAGTRLD